MKTPQRCRFGVFVVCFGHVSHCLVLFPFLALGMQAFGGIICCKYIFYIFIVVLLWVNLEPQVDQFHAQNIKKKNSAKARQIALMLKLGTLKISYVFTFIVVLILSLFLNIMFLAINSIFLKMLKQMLQESFFFYFCIIDAG